MGRLRLNSGSRLERLEEGGFCMLGLDAVPKLTGTSREKLYQGSI